MPPLDHSACAELFAIGSGGGGAFPAPGDLFESVIEDIYAHVLASGDVALDGGAHVGRHAFPMAERVGASGTVLAIEAHSKLARGLVKRARKRRLAQVEVIGKALHHSVGRVLFHQVKEHPAYSGIEARRYDFKDTVGVTEVEATTIDALMSARGALRFVKLDLEGGELRALQGGIATLISSRPMIVFENDQENSARDYKYTKEEWFAFFESTGYEVFTLWGNPYAPADWGRRDIPWYFVAAAMHSSDIEFIRVELPQLLSEYLLRE